MTIFNLFNVTFLTHLSLPELAPAERSFVVFPHPFDKALLHAFHQQSVITANQHNNFVAIITLKLKLAKLQDLPVLLN